MPIDPQISPHLNSRINPALAHVQNSVEGCTRCHLAQTRTNIVFGTGNEHADVVLCGEAPGKSEDEGGFPFTGAAGKRLDALLAIAALERDEIFIANVVKCRPPKNRDPKPTEIMACSPFLGAQIEAIKPKVLVTLGTFSTQFVLNAKTPITDVRGKFFSQPLAFTHHPEESEYNQFAQIDKRESDRMVTVFPVFHPAAAIYDPKKQPILEEDFKKLGIWLKEHQG